MADEKNTKKICVPSSSSTSNPSQEIPASPPRFVSLEELMSAAKGMTQMSLAHEITLNKDFKLEPKEPPANSIEKVIKETIHKAFWDILANELKETPPKYNQVLFLLEEVKSILLDLLLPQHNRLREKIEQVLDLDLIKQQAEKGTLQDEYMGYAQFVISIMGKLCAPVRDEEILKLTKTTEIVALFEGIMKTLKLMKVDMANFTITVMRPQIIANSVAYKKEKFNEFLKVHPDGLERTKEWLKKHVNAATKVTSNDLSKKIDAVLNEAYLDLVQWIDGNLLPETLTMDHNRITAATKELKRLNYAGTVLLLVFTQAGPNLASIAEWKLSIKKTVLTLITVETEPDLKAIGIKMVADVNSAAAQYNTTGHLANTLDVAIQSIDEKHAIYILLLSRIREFLLSTIESQTADRLRIPPGLSVLQEELTQLAGGFLQIVAHNRQVFSEHYINLLTELLQSEY